MADILLIGVNRDAPQTGALASRFQKAGLSIGDVFSEDPALHLAAAGVLVWSEASQHSLFFRDAASRLSRGRAAVVANLTNVPPPACFDNSLSFDLSRWRGDPSDPALDPLVAAARQMVVKDLCVQAECWRTMRRSRDPKPFQDYLARYGPDGAFSSLVHGRLEQLALQQRARLRAPNTAFVLAPAAESASTLDKPSPAASHARSASAAPRAAAEPLRTSPAAAPSLAGGADAAAPHRLETLPVRSRRLPMMLPLLIGAALVGSAYLGAFGVSRYVLGPTESLATDAPVLYLDERAPAARSDAPRPDPLPAQASRRADQGLAQALHAADQDFTVHAGGPLVTSPDSLPSTLTVHNAPAKARPEAALALAAASTEAVEPELAQDDAGIDATAPVLELDALASHESAAGGEPAAAAEDVEPIILDSLYGPQP